jgi:GNAT superfamily N-acetyltransferase
MTYAPWTRDGHEALGRPDLDRVRELETLSARSLPALERQSLAGWVLRASGGVTRRVNSAWPRATSTLTVDQLLRATTTWYGERHLPAVIQLSPATEPPDLVAQLGGWTIAGETLVLERPVRGTPHDDVSVSPLVSEDWWSVATVTAPEHFAGAQEDAGRAVLQAISRQCGYAVAHVEGVAVAVGRAVVDNDAVGVFSMGTLPDHRGAGHGRHVLESLCAWAGDAGATTAWLQVAADNVAARRLYADFEPVYSYAYATRA